LSLPELAGCTRSDGADAKWQPTVIAADVKTAAVYRCGDVTIEAYVVAYINQEQGRELVRVGNVFVPPQWLSSGARSDGEVADLPINVAETEEGTDSVFAMYGYDVNGRPARSVYAEKALEMAAALSLRPVVARAYLVNAIAPRERKDEMRSRVSELTRAILTRARSDAE
jgi:hypothetical protein